MNRAGVAPRAQLESTSRLSYQFAEQVQCFPHFPALLDSGLTETAMLPA
jgi:hypothetical protein